MYELNFYWGVKRHENEECTLLKWASHWGTYLGGC